MFDVSKTSAMMARMPQALYRYSGASGDRMKWIHAALVESNVFFSAPSGFNDPLDCRVPFNFDASTVEIERYWRPVAKEQSPGAPPSEIEKTVESLIMLSQTVSGRNQLNETTHRSIAKSGVLSLSTQEANMLMWSYYAESHKGIVLRFRMNMDNLLAIPEETLPVEVKYSIDLPCIEFYNTTWEERLLGVLGTKADAWKHETEWRLVLVSHTGYVHVPPAMIDGVILGLRTDKDHEADIRSWVKARPVKTDILRIVHKPGSFGLEAVPA